jgi:preprotein translocase subunit SecF
MIISFILMAAFIGTLFVNKSVRGEYMNWTIDFKGGTQITVAFKDPSGKFLKPDTAAVRKALEKAGEEIEVSDIDYDDKGTHIEGLVLSTPKFSAIPDDVKEHARAAFVAKFGDADKDKARPDSKMITRASWSGDRFNVKSLQPISNAEAAAFFATISTTSALPNAPPAGPGTGQKLEVKPWSDTEHEQYTTSDTGTKEYNQWYGIWGVDRQYQQILQSALPNTSVVVVESYGVGAKAGDKLRDDAAKSIVYAIFLIMLYLAFRFDIRYAPGAAFATIHDAVMVIGVFALTFTEVSLTTVAGLLTVMGYSVNDTVIVFDRIRENQAKLKDKSIERIIDISINEMLSRTILTSSTVFATTLIMNIFGTGLVQNFAFAMNVGVVVGTYSSIFLATPFFLYVSKKWYSGPPVARKRWVAPPKDKDREKEKPAASSEDDKEEVAEE